MNFFSKPKTLVEKARFFSKKSHRSVNQKYDGKCYFKIHILSVADIANKFKHLIPFDFEIVLAACYLHDVIEDCRINYNEIKKEFGEQVAELVYALTNEKGRTRKDRANLKYYQGIKNVEYATFVKLCDRIANIEYSKKQKSTMFEKYKKENKFFNEQLYDSRYKEMFDYIDEILK